MTFDAAERIARALLYEGYLLYPYRASAVKNQRRWNFGCVFPPDYRLPANSAEGSFASCECLLLGDVQTEIQVSARFLQIDDEVIEREVSTPALPLSSLLDREHRSSFAFAPIDGTIHVSAATVGENVHKLTVQLRNGTSAQNGIHSTRDDALPFALISSHLLLGIEQGRFLSSQDPPEAVREAAASCRSVRLWPVLVGDPERCDTMLAAPIIVSDFPQVAAESPGDLFDATEMDEMLTLRIRTLTDEEKREAAATDPRAEDLLQRCDAMDHRQLRELHGAWRDESETLTPGMHVRLRPKRNADVYDLALAGKTAVVVSLEQDFEDRVYVTVALDDDPGQDYGIAGRPGHRFYFGLDEVELL